MLLLLQTVEKKTTETCPKHNRKCNGFNGYNENCIGFNGNHWHFFNGLYWFFSCLASDYKQT